jgi:hypothetical protein
MEGQAVDLNRVNAEAAERKADRERAALAKAYEQIDSWERDMQRAFKGICARPLRHAMLRRAGAQHE